MSGLELVAVAAWSFVVAVAGGAVGLVLGNLRLPLFAAVASSPAAGGGANIAVSGIAAATAGTAHIRAGRVNWKLFGWMAPPSVVGALVGGYLAGRVPKTALLLVIAAVLFYSGLDLLLRRPRQASVRAEFSRRAAVVSGAVIGLLGGFVGLILGSLRMPALLRLVGEPASRAVGTNLAVGVCVGVAGPARPSALGRARLEADRGRRRRLDPGGADRRASHGPPLRAGARPRDRLRPARRRHRRGDSGVRLMPRRARGKRRPLRDSAPAPRGTACARSPRTAPTRHPECHARTARPAQGCTRRGGPR